MNLVDKKVIHDIFGKGSVVNYDDSYININFESGDKKFVFPDAFVEHVKFTDEEATNLVKKKIVEKEEELRKEELILKEERAIERERQKVIERQKQMKNQKINPKIQSVFWVESKEEEEKIFREWKIFTGEIKSGQKEGEPRKLARMNEKSACLITRRTEDMEESDRKILGLFMTHESFDGRLCEDGYIIAHPNYRIQLTEEELEKMPFWNYYYDKTNPEETVWNSGRQRYYDNVWTAQILKDIAALREKPEEREEVEKFLDHFCMINLIEKDELEKPKGPLMDK